MKIISSFLLLLCLSLTSSAQKVHFSDSTNKWVVNIGCPGGGASGWMSFNSTYNYTDSLAEWDGKMYHVLAWNNTPIALVREDTMLKKVFIKPVGAQFGNLGAKFGANLVARTPDEFVYMDYSLGLNDTLVMPLVYVIGADTLPKFSKHVVVGIDSILMNNVWHKVFNMNVISGYIYGGAYTWIEGIGCSNTGPVIEPTHPPGCSFKIICFQNKGTYPIESLTDCEATGIGKNDLTNKISFQIFPNPVVNKLTVIADNAMNMDCTVMLSGVLGRSVYTNKFKQQINIDVSALNNGIYFLHLQQGNNTKVSKIVVAH